MCLNIQRVRNKYTGRYYNVPCGKCKECLQRKADAIARRLQSTKFDGCVPYFLTLTYDNHYIPYIHYSDLPMNRPLEKDDFNLRIFRYYGITYNKSKLGSFPYSVLQRELIGTKYIDDCSISDTAYYSRFQFPVIRNSTKFYDKVAVLFYKDVQDFIKRLRNILTIPGYYVCGEYGEKFARPHWHLLLFLNIRNLQLVEKVINHVWLYGRVDLQIARNVNSYLSTYISANTINLHPFIAKYFRPNYRFSWSCRSHSVFDLSKVYQNYLKGNFEYHINLHPNFLQSKEYDFFLPVYLINYYFPNYRLYKYTTALDFYNLLLHRKFYDVENLYKSCGLFSFTFRMNNEIFSHPFVVSLDNTYLRFQRFAKELKISVLDYIIFAFDYQIKLKSYMLKKQYDDLGMFAPFYYDIDAFNILKYNDDILDYLFYTDINSLIKFKESVKNLDITQVSPLFADGLKYEQKFDFKAKKHRTLSDFYSFISNY